MKKFLVLLVIVAMTCMSSMAFAADIAVSGSIEMLMRNYANLDLNDKISDNKNYTQERVRLNIDAKAGDALSGRITFENDWDTWSRFEAAQANLGGGINTVVTDPTGTTPNPTAKTTPRGTNINLREAWLGFKVPGAPVGIKAGHMLLQTGNGWFFRDMKYGSDAWVLYTDIDALHLGVVNIKVAENALSAADDTDAYAFVAAYKLSDTMSAGLNFIRVNDRRGLAMSGFYSASTGYLGGASFLNADVQNLEAHFTGAVGPVKLQAEVDMQMGDAKTPDLAKHKFKGNQVVLQANMALDPVTLNATVARGSGAKATDSDVKEYITLMDSDVHYTLIYEYLLPTAARQHFASTHTGFSNTTAASIGAGFNATKNLMIGADYWYLRATQKVTNVALVDTNDLGMELDVKVNWKLYENLSWNTTIGYFMPGDAYKVMDTVTGLPKDGEAATAIHSVLSFKF